MKDLLTQIEAEFEYHEGEYYFSTTIEGKEYEVSSTVNEGIAMFIELIVDNETAVDIEVKELLFKLVNNGYYDKEADEEACKQYDDNGNILK